MALDQRRVQTAVIGDADSESPVVLPVEAIEVEEFRRLHTADTYWCGLWLGGCGSQLSTKLYQDRACHFAHRPGPHTCRRRFSGVSSADHLFIKRSLLDWLTSQEIKAEAAISRAEDGSRVGSDVVFEPQDRLALQVLLDTEAPARQGTLQILGPGVPHDPMELIRQGYINRIKCIPDGTTRRVQVGTQRRNGTDWFDLHDVHLAPWGLSTPAVEDLRREKAATHLIGAPRATPKPTHAPTAPVAGHVPWRGVVVVC